MVNPDWLGVVVEKVTAQAHQSGAVQLSAAPGSRFGRPGPRRRLLRPLLLLLLQLQLLTIPAITAGAGRKGREEEREHRPLAKPRISRLSLGDLGAQGVPLAQAPWREPCRVL